MFELCPQCGCPHIGYTSYELLVCMVCGWLWFQGPWVSEVADNSR